GCSPRVATSLTDHVVPIVAPCSTATRSVSARDNDRSDNVTGTRTRGPWVNVFARFPLLGHDLERRRVDGPLARPERRLRRRRARRRAVPRSHAHALVTARADERS